MDRAEFESRLREQGYQEIAHREMPAHQINDAHAHDFDAQLLILHGEMTIVRDGLAHSYRSGDTFDMPSGTRHEERAGPEGVRYIAGRRRHAAAAG
ncbi:MAG: cupin [Alphaproteobacteria bacterium]|nr:cupin [Alphaproteobacteria bacterium]